MCEFCGPDSRRKKVSGYAFDQDSKDIQIPMMDDGNGIRLLNRQVLWFDNSNNKCRPGAVYIKYCPFCGEEL